MPRTRTPTQARQGERGLPMLWVLSISTAIAVGLLVGGYFYILSQPAEELAEPVPSITQPANQEESS